MSFGMGPPNDGRKRRGHPSLQSRKNAAARSLEIPQWMFDATTCSNPFGAPTLAIRTETIFALNLWATARSGRISRRAPRKKVSQIPQFQLFQTPSSPGRIENCPAESGELYQLALAATERAGTGWCRIFGRYRGGVTRGTCRAETPQQIFTATPFSRAENVIIWPGF